MCVLLEYVLFFVSERRFRSFVISIMSFDIIMKISILGSFVFFLTDNQCLKREKDKLEKDKLLYCC